jgi:hypothetical protein
MAVHAIHSMMMMVMDSRIWEDTNTELTRPSREPGALRDAAVVTSIRSTPPRSGVTLT